MDRAAEKDVHYYLYAAQLCCKHILSVACQLQRFCMHCLKVVRASIGRSCKQEYVLRAARFHFTICIILVVFYVNISVVIA